MFLGTSCCRSDIYHLKGNCVAISLSTTRPFFVSSVTVGCANSLSTGTSFTVAQQTNNQRAKNETTITTRHGAKEKNHTLTFRTTCRNSRQQPLHRLDSLPPLRLLVSSQKGRKKNHRWSLLAQRKEEQEDAETRSDLEGNSNWTAGSRGRR